jgi:septal ring factor EnvC (AmiA/AmiB activator)
MKILTAFLLSGLLPFSAGAGAQAQDCGVPLVLKMGLDQGVGATVKALEDGQDCLNENQKLLQMSVEELQSPLTSNRDLETEILDLQNKLNQTELDLRMAEARIDTLERRDDFLNHMLNHMLKPSMPPPPVSKPKAPVNRSKPAAKVQIDPATGERAAPTIPQGTH